jgi:Nuclease-related domain
MNDWMLAAAGIAIAAVVVALLAGWVMWRWWARRRRSSIRDVLKAIAVDRLENVLVPDGMGGEIHIEHLLLTTRGILVLNVKAYKGVVFASDRMDQWTAIDKGERSTFQNPLPTLYDRVAAVRQIARDLEVAGFVVFPSLADFSKGRPRNVRLPEDLLEEYAKPDKADVGRLTEAFQPYWERIRAAARAAPA